VEGEGFALTFYLPPAKQGGEPGREAARQKTIIKEKRNNNNIYKNKRKTKKAKVAQSKAWPIFEGIFF